MNVQVSVIIVNYNTEVLLKDCIRSIVAKTKSVDYEIIVVDNASRKNSLSAISKLFPYVRIEYMDQNLGFGMANNKGADLAKGKYLFFLNPDTILINNAIRIFYDYMEYNKDVAVCGGNLYNLKNEPIISYHIIDLYIREWMIIFNKSRIIGFNNTNKPLEVRSIMGADLFIPKNIFYEVGKFDPIFFMYFEEVYLCDNIYQSNYKIRSVPQAKIMHIEGASAENKNNELKEWSYQEHWYSKWIYFYKTRGFLLTSFVYYAHLSKLKLATVFYTLKNNNNKIVYWNLKKDIIKNTYNRYKRKIYNIK